MFTALQKCTLDTASWERERENVCATRRSLDPRNGKIDYGAEEVVRWLAKVSQIRRAQIAPATSARFTQEPDAESRAEFRMKLDDGGCLDV